MREMIGSGLRTLIVGACLTTFASAASAQTTLQYRFKKDETIKYEQKMVMTMKMAVLGAEVGINMEATIGLTLQIDAVDPTGKATLKSTYSFHDVVMELDDGMGKKEKKNFEDLLKEGGADIKEVFEVFKSPFTAIMNAQGEIADFKMAPAWEKLFKEKRNEIGPLSGLLDFDNLLAAAGQQVINPTGLIFPKNAVTKGDKWRGKPLQLGVQGMMTMTQTKEFTMDDPVKLGDQKLEKILSKDSMRFDLDPKAIADKAELKDAKFECEGKLEGHILFDANLGRIHESQMAGNIEMTVGMPDQQEIKMSIHQKVTLKQVKDK